MIFANKVPILKIFQICDNIKNKGWSVKRDPSRKIGPYAWKDDQWVSYDDVSEIARKVCFSDLIKLNFHLCHLVTNFLVRNSK